MAQLNNPDTRIAWQQARQAALAVGLTESLFLPVITASVVGGYQHSRTPLSHTIGNQSNLETNSQKILEAAEARRKQGIATTVELAQARQLVAQAEMNLVIAGNNEREARQILYSALGIPANTKMKEGFPAFSTDLTPVDPPSPKAIEQALAQRPDVLACYALAKAAKEEISAAEADYLPENLSGRSAGCRARAV